MGCSLIIAERTRDANVVRSVIAHPDIWKTISEDGHNIDEYEPNVDESECWLMMTFEGELIGLYNYHAHNSATVEVHAHVLPGHRKQHSKETGIAALKWLYENFPGYNKVIANVPVVYENVKSFTCGCGFQVEGLNRQSYVKNGEYIDQWLLGITRAEIKEFLNE